MFRRLREKKITGFDVFNVVLLGIIGISVLYPFYYAITVSFMTDRAYADTTFRLFPSQVTFAAYHVLFQDGFLFIGYRNSLIITITGLIYSMVITVASAYGFSQKNFPGKKLLFSIIIFPMFFGGGLIPYYMLIKNLGLMDSLMSMVIPAGFGAFNMILIRNYFESLPESLKESAAIDGAKEFTILIKIILPMSLPILATIGLFTVVGFWNTWFGAVLFIRSIDKKPLQLWLREMINTQSTKLTASLIFDNPMKVPTQSVQMAAVFITMLPIMCIYPFLQKYFVKGIMLGAVKG